jgi:arylsulfatase A-like enzyme
MRRLPRVLAAASACGLFAIAPFTATAAERQRPNVVIFLADDAGWGDFGVSGNPDVRTPQVDSLARDGVSLKWFFVQPVCAPTRARR